MQIELAEGSHALASSYEFWAERILRFACRALGVPVAEAPRLVRDGRRWRAPRYHATHPYPADDLFVVAPYDEDGTDGAMEIEPDDLLEAE